MAEIIMLNQDGTPIDHYYQWDTDRTIMFSGFQTYENISVNFCNIDSEKALVVTPVITGNVMSVKVPNILLQRPKLLLVYVCYAGDESTSNTIYASRISVIPRPRPSDYIYTESEVLNYINLDSRIKALEDSNGFGGSGVYTLAEGETIDDAPAYADVVIDPYAEPEVDIPVPEADISMNVEGASVGQIVKIASVDDAGKPTAWEAVEMPSGGGEKEWAYYREQEVGTDDGISVIEFDNLLQYDEALLFIFTPYGQTCAAAVYINGVQVEKDWYNFQHASNNRQNTLHINRIKENYYWVSGYGGNSCSTKATHRVSSELKLRGICDATSSGGINKIGFTVSPILSSASNGSKCIIRYFAR